MHLLLRHLQHAEDVCAASSCRNRPARVSRRQAIEYCYYELDCNGHISSPAKKFHFVDDAHAEKHAKRIIENRDIEIWCGSRLVTVVRSAAVP